jgi:hypothetical protein
MARRRKTHGPATPVDIARRRQEARDGALALAVNAAVRVETDHVGRVTRARRQDVFDLFQSRGKLGSDAYQAVRRLQDDIAILHRVAMGGGDIAPRVDRSRTIDGFSDTRLAAGERIDAVLTRSGAASAQLLVALCEPAVISGRGADWRDVVTRITGERLPDAQGAILRVACENLAGAYASTRASSRRTISGL